MVYTLDIIDGKIEIPKPWKNKRRVRVHQKSSQVILDFEEDKVLNEIDDFESSVLKAELDKGIASLERGDCVVATPSVFKRIEKKERERLLSS